MAWLLLVAGPACLRADAGDKVPEPRGAGEINSGGLVRKEVDATEEAPVPSVKKSAKSGNEWVIAPIPSYDPSQGVGLKVSAQYVFKTEAQRKAEAAGGGKAPPSVLALGTFYTEEKSTGLFAGYFGHFKNDTWRPAAMGMAIRYNYDYYGIGTSEADQNVAVPIQSDAYMAFLQLTRRVEWRGFYAGVFAVGEKSKMKVNGALPPDITLPADELDVTSILIGPTLQYDTRDNMFFPTRGNNADLRWMFDVGDDHYNALQIFWNHYEALIGKTGVLALRGMGRFASGDVPFYGMSQFGQHNDLRGYKNGKYRDKMMVAFQAEWRQMLTRHWGYVVFGGFGKVAPQFGDLWNFDDILPSIGAGIRFRLGAKNPINLRLDYAYGKDGSAGYFSMGEAF